jgi:outer membrane receptor protein involved in Fe transport
MKKRAIVGWILVLCLAFGFGASTSLGQAVYGSIFGTVTDPQGNAVAGARVTVTSLAKGTVVETTTNESGNYSSTHLVPDVYRVKVEATGFKAYDVASTPVAADAAVHLDAQLQVGSLTDTVEVTAQVPQLKTDRSDVSTTFSAQAVENIPLYNRNFTSLQLLSPGNAYMASFQQNEAENPQGSRLILTQGQHFAGTAFELDGTDNQDPILGIILINPNLDAIEEVKITTQNYDAEFGKAIGAVVTTQTKSGTNELHGSAFDYQRSNTNFARNPFTQATTGVPKGNWNQFGGTLGGPIVKNRFFIFGDYQGQRSHVGSTATDRVPTAAERTGDLSDLLPANVNIYDPYQTSDAGHCDLVLTNGQPTPVTLASRTKFPGNVIPACRLSAPALALLKLFPGPGGLSPATILSDNFAASGTSVLDSNGFDIRSDFSASKKLTIFGRYSLQKFTRSGPGLFGTALGGNSFPSDTGGFAGISSVRNDSVAGGFNYSFSPTFLTDFRFGYLRYHVQVAPGGLGTTPAKDAGIPGLNVDTTYTTGMPAFTVSVPGASDFHFGYSLGQNACNCPLLESEHQYQFVSNWTKIKGNHQFKFGADVRFAYNLRVPSDRHRSGELNFDSGITQGETLVNGVLTPDGNGAGLAAFLLGYVTHFQRFVSASTNAYETQPRRFFYAQDTYRATSKLTLNYGVRWDLYIPESVAGKGLGGWVDTKTGEMRVAGQNGVNLQGNTSTSYKHISPRLGIAYQWNPKTVVRLGYGRSYDIGVFGTTFGHIVTQNLPVLAAQEYSGGSPSAQDINTAFFLSNGPVALDPASGLATGNCNKITDPTGTKTQCLGPNGRPMIPDGVSRDIRNFQNTIPSVDAWNISVQRQVTPTLSVTASYVGNKGTHTTGDGADYNSNGTTNKGYFPGCTDDAAGVPNAICVANNAATPKQRTPYYGSSAAYPFPSVAPYGGNFGWTGGDRDQAADLNSKYNALQIQAEKRFSGGLQFQSSYTFQHAIETSNLGTGFARYVNIDPKVNYGPSDSYRNHVFILTQIYELPVGKGKKWASQSGTALNAIVGGWTLNTATNISSGLPWTPLLSSCSASIDSGPCIADVVGSVRAGTRSGDPNAGGYWFQTTNGVALNALGAKAGSWGQTATLDGFGNAGVNPFHGPKFFNIDAGLFKMFNFGERAKAQFQFQAFNLLNHVNLGSPNDHVDAANGGSIGGLAPGAQMRRLQLGLRLTF